MELTKLFTKDIAAKRLGLSVRRLMEISQGEKPEIKRRTGRDPVTGREAVMFGEDDISRYVAKVDFERRAQKIEAENAALMVKQQARIGQDPRSAVIARTQYVVPTPQPLPPAPAMWLTVAQAAEETGLPESALVRLIRAGKLAALDVGVRPGGRWRIKRAELGDLRGERLAAGAAV